MPNDPRSDWARLALVCIFSGLICVVLGFLGAGPAFLTAGSVLAIGGVVGVLMIFGSVRS